MRGTPVLNVEELSVTFPRQHLPPLRAVDHVSFALHRGETLGLVGESGSGKSVTALCLLGLLPAPGRIVSGRIAVLGDNIVGLPEHRLRTLRGRDIGIVFQDPMTGLNPVRRIGTLLIESVRRHQGLSAAVARDHAVTALGDVGIPSPELRLRAYPHELSGGLRQRVMIALALINRPAVIIADEPTTALDATIQAQILDLLRTHVADAGLLMITHDLGVAAELCDHIAVMYHGRIVEHGTVAGVLGQPCHPYTRGLLGAAPRFDYDRPPLRPIPGAPPTASEVVTGCAFAARCPEASARCEAVPPVGEIRSRAVACWHPLDAASA